MKYQLLLDADKVIIGAIASDLKSPETILVDQDVYLSVQGKLGKAKWIQGKVQDLPPQPEPLHPLTARQLRLGLVMNGIALGDVEAAIAAIPNQQDREVATIEWEYATHFERSHPLIAQIATALGLSNEQVDTMWKGALGL